MARLGYVGDRFLQRLGLGGRSAISLVGGMACAIPAVMAARAIPDRRERLLTILVTPMMTCSARLPVYAFLIAFVVPEAPGVGSQAGIVFVWTLSHQHSGHPHRWRGSFIAPSPEPRPARTRRRMAALPLSQVVLGRRKHDPPRCNFSSIRWKGDSSPSVVLWGSAFLERVSGGTTGDGPCSTT